MSQNTGDDFAEFVDEGLFYITFGDVDAPGGPRFLCGLFTMAFTVEEAMEKVDALGLNPGGEVTILQAAEPLLRRLPEIPLDRLLDETELLILLGGEKRRIPSHQIAGQISQSDNGGRHGHA